MPVQKFPKLTSGVVAKYPSTRRRNFRTEVYVHADMTEQRFPKGVPLEEFQLTFNNVSTVDKELVRNFFNDRRGEFDVTWELDWPESPAPADPIVYKHMQFTNPTFEATEFKPGRWGFAVSMKQTRLEH